MGSWILMTWALFITMLYSQVKRCMCVYNAQISTLNLKSAERVLAMIMHLPTLLETMFSLIESKSVNAILGT